MPDIQVKPGMADELLRELAPLLAEEGIDVSNIDVTDPDTLQQALGRAVERRNMAMFTPVGHARELAAVTMRLAAEAIADGDTRSQPESWTRPSPNHPTARPRPSPAAPGSPSGWPTSGCPGTTPAPRPAWPGLPAGHWTGERAARDILTLARKGRVFASLDALIARQGGQHVLYGSALVLAAILQAWARHADTPLIELARTVVR